LEIMRCSSVAPIYWLFPPILIALILTAVLYKETKDIDLMVIG